MAKHADILAFGTILAVLTDCDGEIEPITTPIQDIGGMRMEVRVQKLGKEDKMKLYVFCNEDVKDRLWHCQVRFRAAFDLNEDDIFETKNPCHCYNEQIWTKTYTFDDQHRLKDINKNKIEIKLDIEIGRVYENLPPLDTSLVVNMGEGHSETLLVNKNALANLSTCFRNMFMEEFDKNKHWENCLELNEGEDFDLEALKWIIYSTMIMGTGAMLYESPMVNRMKAVRIIQLAYKLDMAKIVKYCENRFIYEEGSSYSKIEMLGLADHYGLMQLKEYTLEQMSVLDIMELFSRNKEFHSSLSEDTQERLQAKLEGEAEELRNDTGI